MCAAGAAHRFGAHAQKISPYTKQRVRTGTMESEQKYSTDWSAIRSAFEAGADSTRSIAKRFSVSEGAIRKRAKSEHWSRPTNAHDGTQATAYPRMRTERERTNEVRDCTEKRMVDEDIQDRQSPADEDLASLKRLGFKVIAALARELDSLTQNADLIEQIILEETAGDKSKKRREMLLKAISHPVRMTAAKNMAAAFDILYGAGPGKKAQALADVQRALAPDSEWGDLLDPHAASRRTEAWKN